MMARTTSAFPAVSAPNMLDPAPDYQPERYGDLWGHWTVADRASQRVTEIQALLAGLEPELQTQTKEAERLKEKSSKLFAALHGNSRSIVPNALRRIHSASSARTNESKDTTRREFELAHREETSMASRVESLRERIDDLKAQIQKNMGLASEADPIFELLGASVAGSGLDGKCTVTVRKLRSEIEAQKLVTDLTRARVTVQHAHHYYTIVLHTIDAVRGTALGRAAFGGLGEMSKNKDYQVAADTASKAQICFNETVRVLSPHAEIIPPEVMTDFEKLKEMGLLQASKIYGLMYGWRHPSSGVGKSVKLMLQKQETVFASLTRLAVWIQNKVPIFEAELRAARISRDQARRDLVTAWKIQVDREGLQVQSIR